jgi:hypothetical protein
MATGRGGGWFAPSLCNRRAAPPLGRPLPEFRPTNRHNRFLPAPATAAVLPGGNIGSIYVWRLVTA